MRITELVGRRALYYAHDSRAVACKPTHPPPGGCLFLFPSASQIRDYAAKSGVIRSGESSKEKHPPQADTYFYSRRKFRASSHLLAGIKKASLFVKLFFAEEEGFEPPEV